MTPSRQKYTKGKRLLKVHDIIFEADSKAGRVFDILLMWAIVLSVIAVMADSVQDINFKYGHALLIIEWFFTILFTIEYALRLACVGQPLRYATSFYGIIDLLAIVPTYISIFIPHTQYLLVVRILRVLRVFRVLKLAHFVGEASMLMDALRASGRKIAVFLFAVLNLVVIFGAIMYLVEGYDNGFTSIPKSIYWCIVTLTTVGYGDILPQSNLGQLIASCIMITGYGIIAVPTGIVTAELSIAYRKRVSTQSCPQCTAQGHDVGAIYCKECGTKL